MFVYFCSHELSFFFIVVSPNDVLFDEFEIKMSVYAFICICHMALRRIERVSRSQSEKHIPVANTMTTTTTMLVRCEIMSEEEMETWNPSKWECSFLSFCVLYSSATIVKSHGGSSHRREVKSSKKRHSSSQQPTVSNVFKLAKLSVCCVFISIFRSASAMPSHGCCTRKRIRHCQ